MFNKIHRGILTLMLLTAGLVLGNASYATIGFPGPLPLGLTNPDIVANILDIDYTYGGGFANNELKVMGTLGTSTGNFVDASGNSYPIDTGTLDYSLDAILDYTNNNALLSGTLTIKGGIAGLGISSGSTLLLATLTDLGTSWPVTQNSGTGVFKFLGTITSSDSALGFGPGVIVNMISNDLAPKFTGDENFVGTVQSADNSTPVPEPGTLLLLAAGGLALGGVRRQRAALTD